MTTQIRRLNTNPTITIISKICGSFLTGGRLGLLISGEIIEESIRKRKLPYAKKPVKGANRANRTTEIPNSERESIKLWGIERVQIRKMGKKGPVGSFLGDGSGRFL